MHELFVPYNLALIIKEKGFNEDCLTLYKTDKRIMNSDDWCCGTNNSHLTKEWMSCLAPTYQQAIDWLDKKDIHVESEYDYLKNCYNIKFVEKKSSNKWMEYTLFYNCKTKKEALDRGIEEALKLI